MLVVLSGPTASGKSSLALSVALEGPLAQQIEIISMDSAQVYRGMDLGTAKPSAAERAAVAHHLIDVIDPWEAYSAARFRADALNAAASIRARGRIPLVVGGSLLYGKALGGGLSALPASDPDIRKAVASEAASKGWPAMHQALALVDPQTAKRLNPQDAQRISRALEVFRHSGKPLSSWIAEQSPSQPAANEEALVWISLEPRQRSWLHERIACRFRHMLEQGLLAEVAALMAHAGMHAGLASMRAVGYRQCVQWLEGTANQALHSDAAKASRDDAGSTTLRDDAGSTTLRPTADALEARGIAATRQFAKRQLTWLRAMPERQVFACDEANEKESARQALTDALYKSAAAASRLK
ncbi:MAG: tRNA (adenosine(37)-N6)-dimethylallyltransferase MiaA [Betaproteobacteria bacterium]|nr:tRNA (adenosine(37)-N6)-dimethylallyltransferase MiaA [Betaproteobacteria bacterium]NDA05040.1 tRNA (adenosine(37)-N6)-dimethylallyltransferase MiaA [Betaproteobacteria bacterium]NDF91884.1 tRNA (adenosine(37)-N6)-dimethylallyltransferase MiaA [Betaproteobacteria bacterium]